MFRHKKAELLFGFYSFLSLAFLAWSADRVVHSLKQAFHYLWSPTGVAVVGPLDQGGRFSARLAALLRADQRARAFEARWIQERLDTNRLKILEDENKKLTEFLGLAPNPGFRSKVARVWARDPSDWFHSLLVKPEGPGVGEGDAVVAMEGGRPVVVGQVRELLADGKARVLLLTDSFSALSAQVVRTGEQGLLEGRGGSQLLLNYLFADSDIRVGDEVVTAGLGEVYPPQLLIGTVTEVLEAKGAVAKRALVIPSVRLGYVREIQILTRLKSSEEGVSTP